MTTILVTGATGTVGSQLVPKLAGVTVRAGVRRPGAPGTVEFDFERPDTMAAALRGVDAVFLLAPNLRDQVGASTRLVELAAAAGVSRIVKLSALGCDAEPSVAFGRAHRAVERVIEGSGLGWTFLRPNNFLDNFLGVRHGSFAPDARGEIRIPWGHGACSFIAADDIAAVAARVLVDSGHGGKIYDLTGRQALRIDEVAAQIAAATGKPCRYVDVPEAEARRALLAARMPPPVVEAMLELHALGKAGRTAVVTSAVADITGRPATAASGFAWGAP